MRKIIFLFAIILAIQISYGQTMSDYKKTLTKNINKVNKSKGKVSISIIQFRNYNKTFPKKVYKSLNKYEKDTLANIRIFVYEMYNDIAQQSIDSTFRKAIVVRLVKACADNDNSVRERVSNLLQSFNKNDFNKEAKKILTSYLSQSPEIFKNTARLCGYLDMTEVIPLINNKLKDSLSRRVKWELKLTLARLGDDDKAYECTEFVRMQGINDRKIHYLFNDLIYTRNRIAFDYIIEELNNDELNCKPSNPYLSDNITCAYRIMELLAPYIKNFPYKIYPGTNQLIANDYDKALKNVRDWFSVNSDYIILKDKF